MTCVSQQLLHPKAGMEPGVIHASRSRQNEAHTSREEAVDYYGNLCQIITHACTHVFQQSVKDMRRKDSSVRCKFNLYQFTVGDLLHTFHMRLSVVDR